MALFDISTQQEFQLRVLKNSKIVIVDFWAVWCPPCRMMAPVLESLAKKFDDKLDVVKINVEASHDNAKLAQEYGVQGIPNMQVFRDGSVIKELVGARPPHVLEEEIKDFLV
ncbi:MAG: thioredoxin [Candidatus Saccharimonadales bacterium]